MEKDEEKEQKEQIDNLNAVLQTKKADKIVKGPDGKIVKVEKNADNPAIGGIFVSFVGKKLQRDKCLYNPKGENIILKKGTKFEDIPVIQQKSFQFTDKDFK